MITILLPVKNESEFIEDCLDSIFNQSYKNWELIIVNDHSSDDTLQKVKRHPVYLKNTQLIYNEGTGLIAALQSGWKHVTGKYITRMDGDDVMPPKKLEILLEVLQQENQPTIVTGCVEYFPRENLTKGYRTYERWLNNIQIAQSHHQMIYRECVFASPNWMMKASDLKSIGGFDDLIFPEDYALALKCHQAGFHFRGIEAITHHWRHHGQRMSNNHEGYTQKAFFDLKINHWIKYQYDDQKTLLLWGQNNKTKLTSQILRTHQIKFHTLTETEVEKTKEYISPQLLICVYPGAKLRNKLRDFLTTLKLKEGDDYWFL